MRGQSRSRWVRVGGICCLASGCVATSLPSDKVLSKSPPERVSSFTPVTIWVEDRKYPAHAKHLADALRATGVFSSVYCGPTRPSEPVDFVAVLDRHPYSTDAMIPGMAILTLGLIPTIQQNDHIGFRFRLDTSGGKTVGVVDASWRATTVVGWAAVPLGLGSDWYHGDPRMSRRANCWVAEQLRTLGVGVRVQAQLSANP